jgi:ribosomal protein L11 methyltransferase
MTTRRDLARCRQIGLTTLPEVHHPQGGEQDWVRLTSRSCAYPHRQEHLGGAVVARSTDPDALILELDPGLAFGTGSHPTTRCAWNGWKRIRHRARPCSTTVAVPASWPWWPRRSAPARWWAWTSIRRPSSRPTTRATTAKSITSCPIPSPSRKHATQRFDIVVANILSSPLKLMAPMLSGRVADGGALILSGVLARQAEEVAAAYAPFIKLGVWAEQDGWVALHGRLGSDVVPARVTQQWRSPLNAPTATRYFGSLMTS